MPTDNPPDIELELYQKLWTILEGYTPWANLVKEGNRVKRDREDNQNPDKNSRHDGDYPQADIENSGGSSTLFQEDETLGTLDGPCSFAERQSHAFTITVATINLSYLEAQNIRRLTCNALRLAGPRLGLEYVVKWGWRWSLSRQASEPGEVDQVLRNYIKIDVGVETISDGRHLTGET